MNLLDTVRKVDERAFVRPAFGLNCFDILVLTGFVAQPLFELIARFPGFLVVHRSTPADLLALVFCAYAIPAGTLIALESLTAALAPRTVATIHAAFLSFLLTLNVLPIVKRSALPGAASLVLAIVAGVLLSQGYLRVRTRRWSLIYLMPIALVVFPAALFLFSPASSTFRASHPPKALFPRIEHPAPIVFVVFDEFPLASLMDKSYQIDRNLYPNFAELARISTWYRSVTAVGESTLIALPSILSGEYPDYEHPRLPDANGHPDTLFTLLGGSYRLNVRENNTRLCPERLCGAENTPTYQRVTDMFKDAGLLWLYAVLPSDFTGSLPDITQSWIGFRPKPDQEPTLAMWKRFDELTDWHDRTQQFRQFVASLRPSPRPTLHFLHILLPHAPWEYLPSGQRYTLPESRIRGLRGINDRGDDADQWTGDSWAVAQSYQRHLLQVGLVDRMVGSLIKQLHDIGLYDSALVIITADHGASFRPRDSRRSVTPTNHADIMSVPLFIKYPGQREGKIDDRNAEAIDILPTILDVLNVQARWRVDGHSLLDAAPPERRTKVVVTDGQRKFEFPARFDDLAASVDWKLRIFGDESGCTLYRLGDRQGWTGRTVPNAMSSDTSLRYQLERDRYYANVDPSASVLLSNISGRIMRGNSSSSEGPIELAVAVNGKIGAVTETYQDSGQEKFSALVPAPALHAGCNEVAVFRIRGAELEKIDRVAAQQYRWGIRLKFGVGGNAAPYFGVGWSKPEEDLSWTDGHVATLYLPTPAPPGDVILLANLGAFTSSPSSRQRVRVLVNGHEVARWAVATEFRDFTAQIPRWLGESGVEITFELPDAVAPIAVGGGSDSRTLGVAMTQLGLSLR